MSDTKLTLDDAGVDALFNEGVRVGRPAPRFVHMDRPPWPAATERDPHVVAVRARARALCVFVQVPAELAWFRGHFPGRAILPGVAQIDWVGRLAERLLECPVTGFRRLEAVKFKAPVLPDAVLRIDLEMRGRTLRFKVASRDGTHSEGRLGYDA